MTRGDVFVEMANVKQISISPYHLKVPSHLTEMPKGGGVGDNQKVMEQDIYFFIV